MQYFYDGAEISAREAGRIVASAALERGWDIDEANALWNARAASEESREALFDLCDYSLEIVTRD